MRSFILTPLVAAAASASVIPSTATVVATKMISGRAVTVSPQDLDNFKFYAQYAGSAYCNNDAAAGALVACGANVCPAVMANGAKVLLSLDGDTGTNMDGYVAQDDARKLIVVSLRGSKSIRNWLANILFGFDSSCNDLVSGCKTHTGFWAAWTQIRTEVLNTVAAAKRANPSYKVVSTGHSLGGAVATIAAAYLRKAGYATDLYTYGAPRAGNEEFVSFITSQAGAEYRITHVDDPVPRLPPMFLGYRHTSPEYWLFTGTSTTVNYGIADIKVCEGFANADCNADTGGLNVEAHLYYLLHISGCGPSGIEWKREKEAGSAPTISDEELAQRLDLFAKMDREYAAALKANATAA